MEFSRSFSSPSDDSKSVNGLKTNDNFGEIFLGFFDFNSISAPDTNGWIVASALYDYRARSARELALQKGCKILLKERLRYDLTTG